jgi:hypothetical protein
MYKQVMEKLVEDGNTWDSPFIAMLWLNCHGLMNSFGAM